MSDNVYNKFPTPLGTLDSSYNFYVVKNGQDGRIPLSSFYTNGYTPYLKPVDTLATLNALSKANLMQYTKCYVEEKDIDYIYDGTNWSPETTTSFDEFTGLIDNVGGTSLKYATLSAAYAAQKKYDIVTANTTETAATVLSAADQLFWKISQNVTWDQDEYEVDGTANGVQVTIEMADISSVYKFNFPASTMPFKSFGGTSVLNIKGNGGTIINESAANDIYIYNEGRSYYSDLLIKLPNRLNGGIRTSNESFLTNITLEGGGAACEYGLLIDGGNINGLNFTGTWNIDATLNYVGVQANIHNLNYNLTVPATFVLNGNLSNVNTVLTVEPTSQGNLIIDCQSSSNISNGNFSALTFGADVENVNISNCILSDMPTFSVDNSNKNITFTNCTFGELVEVYGTGIKFNNCNFLTGFDTKTGSSGAITGSDSAVSPTLNGTFRRSGNDSNIGNDYA